MTRFEKIKQELTLEKMAEFIDGCCDEYCFEMCERKTGNKYKCPAAKATDDKCLKCAMEWLQEEVKDDE